MFCKQRMIPKVQTANGCDYTEVSISTESRREGGGGGGEREREGGKLIFIVL